MLLRKCIFCGLEAHTQTELKKFKIAKRSKYGRENRCRKCSNKRWPESPEKKKEYAAKWRERNPEYMKKWIKKNPEYMKEWCKKNPNYWADKLKNQFMFKGKSIYPDKNPRLNVCSECGKTYPEDLTRQTDIHHVIYDVNNPLSFTIELCQSCHMKLHWKIWKGIVF